MHDLPRSLTVLAMTFVAVIVATLALAAVIVPGSGSAARDPDAGTPAPSAGDPVARPSIVTNPNGLGGALAVTGDRTGTFHLTRELHEDRYTLAGDDGRLIFAGDPIAIDQFSYDGLEFFPDPDECLVTPGELDTTTGVGRAEIVCEELRDVRDTAVITMAGEIGLPANLLGQVDLPPAGGSLAVGDETWAFDSALLFAWGLRAGTTDYNMTLLDDAAAGALHFTYDHHTHRTDVAAVEHDGAIAAVPAGSCSLTMREVGRYSPTATVLEMTIGCAAVDVPGVGSVPIRGTVVVEQLEEPI